MSVFKYKFAVSQQTQLKSSHQKKLLQSLKKQYPFVDDITWKTIFPSKSSVLMSKLSNKIVLYSIKLKGMSSSDKPPILFFQMKVYGKDQVYPTLYLLWKLPNFLPCICIHSPVSQYILRGADLMLPGVSKNSHQQLKQNTQLNTINAKDLKSIRVNDVLSIKIIGNPLPVGIGYSILSGKDICIDGAKGRFMKMMHIFRDQLWEFGGKIKPNAGFLSNVIKPIEMNDNNIDTKQNNNNKIKQNDSKQNDQTEQDEKNNSFNMKFKALSADNKLIYGFFMTLLTISSSCLPVIIRDIYQQMRQNSNVAQFKELDVKQTSFSKLGRFAQAKQFEKFIQCKQQKSKIFIQAMDPKAITKHLLLMLHKIETNKFDAIMNWFQQNWSDLQSKDEPETIEGQNETKFQTWYDIEYKSSEDTAENVINNLFGSWSNISESNDICEAFLNHLSETFNVILSAGSSESKVDTKNCDQVFRLQFLQTLKASIDPNELPVSASSILTRKKLYILKPKFVFSKRNLLRVNLEQDIVTSVKQTRWKKSAKFLKDLSKQSIIQLKDYGNVGGELMITDINYSYLTNQFNITKEYEFFTPETFEKFCAKIKELQQKQVDSEETKQNDNNKVEEMNFVATDKKRKICIQIMYRANHRLLPIFGENNISILHSKNKARTFLWSYVQNQNLVGRNKSQITISEQLYHMLYDSKLFHNKLKDGFRNKKGKEKLAAIKVGSVVHRKDLVNLFDEYMQAYTAIILDDDEEPKFKPGFPPKIEIQADKRQGTKYMTHVTGLEDYGIDTNEFATTAKKYFAAAVTTSALSGKKAKMKGGKMKRKVSIQGNMVKDVSNQDVPTLLMKHYGIPNQFINAKTNITKQPKR